MLPIGSKFIDPYDKTAFSVNTSETLSAFLERIRKHRETNNYPKILDSELRPLVVSSLYESTDKSKQAQYFILQPVPVTSSQVISLAKALAKELVHTNTLTVKDREYRAKKCLDCTFHKTNSLGLPKTEKLISKVVGLANLQSSPSENKLGECGMCGCPLQTKVKFQLMSVLVSLVPENIDKLLRMYGPQAFSKCWMLEESIKHTSYKELLRKKLKAGKERGSELLDEFLSAKIKRNLHGK